MSGSFLMLKVISQLFREMDPSLIRPAFISEINRDTATDLVTIKMQPGSSAGMSESARHTCFLWTE